MYRIGIDVGGTFTDFAAVDNNGKVTIAKSPSTPADQSIGVTEGLSVLAEEIGIRLDQLMAQTQLIVHGTTVATNALLERKGATVGILTTDGHRDVIEQREGLKPERYNYRLAHQEAIVPRYNRIGVEERIRYDGSIETPLNEDSVLAAVRSFKNEEVNAVAICFINAFVNGDHEKQAAEIIRKEMPEAYVCLSSDVLPQIKEYERFSTTTVNAYVGPAMENYLSRLENRLRKIDYQNDILIMHSHGGVATISESTRLSAGCVLSGPAGGIAGAIYSANILEEGNLITFDMGGTSSDIAMLENSIPQFSSDGEIAGTKVALPSIDIHTLGAGGGSIAYVDTGGMLHVGPESAGADPGPACYGKGGTRMTVTDANVELGYYDPDKFLGGRVKFDSVAADRACSNLAKLLSCSNVEAAEGVQRLVNTQMSEGIRLVSVRRGVDPRKFTLLSFGGAAGLHIADIARMLDIKRVVIPKVASVLSAFGMLASDLRHEFVRSCMASVEDIDIARLAKILQSHEELGRKRLGQEFSGNVEVLHTLDMRYGEQVFEIQVPIGSKAPETKEDMINIAEKFHSQHETLYTYSSKDQEVVIVNARTTVIGKLPEMKETSQLKSEEQTASTGAQKAYVDGNWHTVPTYDFDKLSPGQIFVGPALIQSKTTTVLAGPRDKVKVTPHGWLDIDIGK